MVIAHLYSDLANLFGSNGNMKAIYNYLKDVKIKTELRYYSVGDNIPFDEIDLLFIGEASDDNLDIIKNDILKRKKEVKKYIESDKFVFVAGQTLKLFGTNSLEILGFTPIELENRITGEFTVTTDLIEGKLIALYNQYSKVVDAENYLFKFDTPFDGEAYEGIKYKNFYGTYLMGPLLIRNPFFTEYLIDGLIKKSNLKKDGEYKNKLDKQAYDYYFSHKKR